jgi:antitoxin (DNA-binding transcriptional repressor) of toxin-antitoxin stability system
MKTMTVAEFKARFSSVLDEIVKGRPVAIGYGRNREKVAVLVPWREYQAGNRPKPGLLKGRAAFRVRRDGKLSDAEFLAS